MSWLTVVVLCPAEPRGLATVVCRLPGVTVPVTASAANAALLALRTTTPANAETAASLMRCFAVPRNTASAFSGGIE